MEICELTGESFEVSPAERQFTAQFGVDRQRLCPLERQRRRAAHRNFTNLYWRTGDSGKFLSMYDEHAKFPVYSSKQWWGDSWDAKSFGREVDFSKPFFDSYAALKNTVPHFATIGIENDNCDYSNAVFNSRNCYLCFGCVKSSDCLYSHIVWECESCVDCLYIFESQWCSHSTDIVGCYDVHYATEAVNCSESYFLHDCKNCAHCFGCVNLRGKQYCWFNQQLSKDAYLAKLAALKPLKRKTIDSANAKLAQYRSERAIYPAAFESQCEEIDGNHLYYSQNCRYSFDLKRSEGCRYSFTALSAIHCQDTSFGGHMNQFCFEGLTLRGCERVMCSHYLSDSSDSAYSEFCFNCRDVFGCNGLRNAQFCILNRQYSKEEYARLRALLVEHMKSTGEWGEFFPAAISPFAYNESIAGEYTPLSEAECAARGYRYKSELHSHAAGVADAGAAPTEPPESIDETSDTITSQLFSCPESGRGYKYIAAEVAFYRRTGIPLPGNAFAVRHQRRIAQRQPRRLEQTACGKCGVALNAAPIPGIAGRLPYCSACYQDACSR